MLVSKPNATRIFLIQKPFASQHSLAVSARWTARRPWLGSHKSDRGTHFGGFRCHWNWGISGGILSPLWHPVAIRGIIWGPASRHWVGRVQDDGPTSLVSSTSPGRVGRDPSEDAAEGEVDLLSLVWTEALSCRQRQPRRSHRACQRGLLPAFVSLASGEALSLDSEADADEGGEEPGHDGVREDSLLDRCRFRLGWLQL